MAEQQTTTDGDTEHVSLRELLGAAPEPDFELTVPKGWERVSVDEAGESMLTRRLKQRSMQTGRPELQVLVGRMLRESFEGMRSNGAVAAFMPVSQVEDGLYLPASIIAVIRRSTPDSPLDAYAQQAIRQYAAQPLFGDLRTLRFETESEQEVDGQPIVISSSHYLTPMPGTRRKTALELMATYGRPVNVSRDAERIVAIHGLFDICASTLRWVPPRGAE